MGDFDLSCAFQEDEVRLQELTDVLCGPIDHQEVMGLLVVEYRLLTQCKLFIL